MIQKSIAIISESEFRDKITDLFVTTLEDKEMLRSMVESGEGAVSACGFFGRIRGEDQMSIKAILEEDFQCGWLDIIADDVSSANPDVVGVYIMTEQGDLLEWYLMQDAPMGLKKKLFPVDVKDA